MSIIVAIIIGSKQQYDNVKTIKDKNRYIDIYHTTKRNYSNGAVSFKVPKKDTYQDYNTYYGNKILIDFENQVYVDNEALRRVFFEKERIFESVESLYYYQELLEDMYADYHDNEIKNALLDMLNMYYDDDVSFDFEKYDTYIKFLSKDEQDVCRLNDLMMTIYLCDRYGVIDKLNIDRIKSYIDSFLNDGISVLKLNPIIRIYNCLDYPLDDIYNISYICDSESPVAINNYVEVSLCLGKNVDSDHILQILKYYIKDSSVDHLMELYYAVDSLQLLGLLDEEYKKELTSVIYGYRYADGIFPVISGYIPDNKQLLIYHMIMARFGEDNNIIHYKKMLNDEFDSQDSYDLYAYSYFASRLNISSSKLKEHISSKLKNCTTDDLSAAGYIMLACKELDLNSKKVKPNEDIILYIDQLLSRDKPNYMPMDLILLYGAAKYGIISFDSKTLDIMQNMNLSDIKELKAIYIYYLYMILDMNNRSVDHLKKEMETLRCNGGYKMDVEDDFFDLMATYYCTMIIE